MLEILINSEFLDLGTDIEIPLVLNNPIFNTEGTHTLSFEFPKTDKNKRIFNFSNRLELSENKAKEFNAVIRWSALELFAGTLKIRDVGSKFTAYFITNNGNFNSKVNKLNLLDLSWDTIEVENMAAHAKEVSILNYPNANYAFPMVYNTELYEDKQPDFSGVINRYDVTNEVYFENETTNYYALIPFFYLLYILENIAKNLGYIFKGNFLKDVEINKILLFNNFCLDYFEKINYFEASGDTETFRLSWQDTERLIFETEIEDDNNIYDSTTGLIMPTLGDSILTINLKLDRFSTWYFPTNKVVIQFGYYYSGTFYYLSETEVKLLGSTSVNFIKSYTYLTTQNQIDLGYRYSFRIRHPFNTNPLATDLGIKIQKIKLTHEDVTQSNLNIFKNKIEIKNHIPNINISKFLNAIKKTFGVVYFVDEITKTVDFEFLNNIIDNQKYVDITEKTSNNFIKTFPEDLGFNFSFQFPNNEDAVGDIKSIESLNYKGTVNNTGELPELINLGEIYLNLSTNTFLISEIINDLLQWNKYSENLYNFIVGDGSNLVVSDLSPMMQIYARNAIYGYITSRTLQKGTSPIYSTGFNDFGLQMMLYHGFQENASGDLYPMSSSLNKDYNGNEIGGLELKFDGEFGLYEVYLKKYCEWYINRRVPVEKSAKLDIAFLRNIDFTIKYRINHIDFFIDKIETTLTTTGMKLSKIYLLKA